MSHIFYSSQGSLWTKVEEFNAGTGQLASLRAPGHPSAARPGPQPENCRRARGLSGVAHQCAPRHAVRRSGRAAPSVTGRAHLGVECPGAWAAHSQGACPGQLVACPGQLVACLGPFAWLVLRRVRVAFPPGQAGGPQLLALVPPKAGRHVPGSRRLRVGRSPGASGTSRGRRLAGRVGGRGAGSARLCEASDGDRGVRPRPGPVAALLRVSFLTHVELSSRGSCSPRCPPIPGRLHSSLFQR